MTLRRLPLMLRPGGCPTSRTGKMDAMELLGGWVRHARRMAPGVDRADLEVVGLDLLERYDQPHRAYHDKRHLAEVVAAVALLAEHAHDLSAVMLAAWWHDAVYEVGAGDNEEASAALATATLAGWDADPDRTLLVGDLVRSTLSHDPPAFLTDALVLCDADLAILASPPNRYAVYTEDVRREYAAVAREDFDRGRAALLQGLLDRPAIYRTASAHERWEAAARANLAAELRSLTG
jgi:predicted metal-dependent HD superfamily phosphohydrolase